MFISMKVVLLKDVKKIGRTNETIEVADGFALNHLIPKKLAMAATRANLKQSAARQGKITADRDMKTALLAQNIATLAEKQVVIKVKVNEQGHLYDAVDEKDIIVAAKESADIDLPEGIITLEKPIKEVGTFEIPVATGETFGKFTLVVEAE
jgi:large subunit ribosomal protein L9